MKGGNIYGCIATTHGDCHQIKEKLLEGPYSGQNYQERLSEAL
jgi:hypothetical protein